MAVQSVALTSPPQLSMPAGATLSPGFTRSAHKDGACGDPDRPRPPRRIRRLIRRGAPMMTVIIGLASVLTACGDDDPTYDHRSVAYVVDKHRNSPVAMLTLAEVLDEVIAQRGSFTVVGVDGEPDVIVTADFDLSGNDDRVAYDAAQLKQAVFEKVKNAKPDDAETDTLAGMELGRRAVRDADTEVKKVVVESSGLSTRGAVNYLVPGALYAVPAERADSIVRSGNGIGDSHGIAYGFVGLGDVQEPQQPLTNAQRTLLIETCTLLVERAGGDVTVNDSPRADSESHVWSSDTPPVSVVPIAEEFVPAPAPTVLPAAEFFVENSADLIDEDRAVELLRPFAEQAKQAGSRIELVGTTARDGSEQYQLDLGQRRADAIKSILVNRFGLAASQINTRSEGSFGPTYQIDHDDAGNLLPDIAAQNRTVRISLERS